MNTCAALALVLHAYTWHSAPVVNDDTLGAGINCNLGEWEVESGAYINSGDFVSAYLGGGREVPLALGFSAGMWAAMASGYSPPLLGGVSFTYTAPYHWRLRILSGYDPKSRVGIVHLEAMVPLTENE